MFFLKKGCFAIFSGNHFFALQITIHLTIAGCVRGHDSTRPVRSSIESKQDEEIFYDAVSDSATGRTKEDSENGLSEEKLPLKNKLPTSSDIDNETIYSSQSSQLSEETMASVRSKATEQIGGTEIVKNTKTPDREVVIKEANKNLKRADQWSEKNAKK